MTIIDANGWILFRERRPSSNPNYVWIGSTATVHPAPVLAYGSEYNRLLGGITQNGVTPWTHWQPCKQPATPQRTTLEIAWTAVRAARSAGWTDEQLMDAIVAVLQHGGDGDA